MTDKQPDTKAQASAKASNRLFDIPALEDDGSNFSFWKFRVNMILELRGLWGIVSGSEKKPTDTTKLADWLARDHEARAQISLMLKDEPLNGVLFAKTAQEAWESLVARYEGKGEQKMAYLIDELFHGTLSDDSPLSSKGQKCAPHPRPSVRCACSAASRRRAP